MCELAMNAVAFDQVTLDQRIGAIGQLDALHVVVMRPAIPHRAALAEQPNAVAEVARSLEAINHNMRATTILRIHNPTATRVAVAVR